jgi:hypothetical protein
MGGPTRSYAAAVIALEFIGAHKPPDLATKCFRQGGDTIEGVITSIVRPLLRIKDCCCGYKSKYSRLKHTARCSRDHSLSIWLVWYLVLFLKHGSVCDIWGFHGGEDDWFFLFWRHVNFKSGAGNSLFLWNVGICLHVHMTLQDRRLTSTS